MELTESEVKFIDELIADTDDLLASEGIEIQESVETVDAYVDALNLILKDEDLQEDVQEALALGIALLEGPIHTANRLMKKSTPAEIERIAKGQRRVGNAEFPKKTSIDQKTASKASKEAKLDKFLNVWGHQTVKRAKDARGVTHRIIAARDPSTAELQKARAAIKPAAEPKSTVLGRFMDRYGRKPGAAKKAANESVEPPSVDEVISEMVGLLESCGYTVPDEISVHVFAEDVAGILENDKDLSEDNRAFLQVGLEATIQGLTESEADAV